MGLGEPRGQEHLKAREIGVNPQEILATKTGRRIA
jgi:hypothetical protein